MRYSRRHIKFYCYSEHLLDNHSSPWIENYLVEVFIIDQKLIHQAEHLKHFMFNIFKLAGFLGFIWFQIEHQSNKSNWREMI